MSAFSKFAVETCGCEDSGDRVKLRKSVWHQTVGLRLRDFQNRFHQIDRLKAVASMECPVQILGKNMTGPRDESCPSKIIQASKLLRAHTNVSEETTCRGCSKRSRCPFARKSISNISTKTSLGALSKVLYGMSQSCRLYLKDPETHPFMISVEEIEAGIKLTDQLGRFMEPWAIDRQLRNVAEADRKALKAIVTRQIRKNQELKKKREEARKLGLPEELADVPTTEQKPLDEMASQKGQKFDINSDDWIPEEKFDEFSSSKSSLLKPDDTERIVPTKTMVEAERVTDTPIPERYPNGRKIGHKSQDMQKKKSMIDLSKVDQCKAGIVTGGGGYVIGQSQPVHSDGIEYIKGDLLRGKTVLDNVSLASKLWEKSNPYITELKFLKRVPFKAAVTETTTVDPTLARALSASQPLASLTPVPKRKVKVSLMDKQVDMRGVDLSQSHAISNIEIHTAPLSNTPLYELQEQSDTTVGNEESPKASGKLQFPKLPSWDPESVNKIQSRDGRTEKVRLGVNGIVTERLRTDFSKLMRPPQGKEQVVVIDTPKKRSIKVMKSKLAMTR